MISRLHAICESCPWEGSRTDTFTRGKGPDFDDTCPRCASTNVTVLDPKVDQPELVGFEESTA